LIEKHYLIVDIYIQPHNLLHLIQKYLAIQYSYSNTSHEWNALQKT